MTLIGQNDLLKKFTDMVGSNELPRFIILVGPKGCGKKTLAREIAKLLKISWVNELSDVKVDNIRKMINDSYKVLYPTVFIIPDADTMSISAKNAILKITEEPPNKVYFIMTLETIENTLETVKSRAAVFSMQSYTADEITEYSNNTIEKLTDKQRDIILSICSNPGEVDLINSMGIEEFYDYVNLVVDNIADTTLANSFKIVEKISIKKDADGYDLKLFWLAFMNICLTRLDKSPVKYSSGVSITSKFLNKLGITGISKSMLFDDWILAIRNVWEVDQ